VTRTRHCLVTAVATLAVATVTRSARVPARWDFSFNLATAATVLAIGIAGGLDRERLGVDPRRLRAGLRLGARAFGAISAVVVAGGLLGLVTDDRTDVGAAAMIGRVLLVIPIGTVLVEELAFRGVLHGLLCEVAGRRAAIVTGALLFGLWHVYPAWHDGSVDVDGLGRLGTVAGTFAATALAGVAVLWQRERSGSLLAPMLAHLATNSVTFAVAWATN
jgi:membrane protease YdiL (CAAX protease family)